MKVLSLDNALCDSGHTTGPIIIPRPGIPDKSYLNLLDDRVFQSDGRFIESYTRHIKGERPDVVCAYLFAAMAHNSQMRVNGELYLDHLLGVYNILKHDFGADKETRAAGLLHDILENTPISLEVIYHLFGPEISLLVDGMTKPPKTSPLQEGHLRYIEKFLEYAEWDKRLILVRLADRLHNMRTLDCFRSEKRQRIAEETLRLYLHLAEGLPIHDELLYHTKLHRC